MNGREAPRLRIPPYAEHISSTERGIWISAGPEAWPRARRWRWEGKPGLVADPKTDPRTFAWPVKGRTVRVIALDLPRAELVRLLGAIARAKPTTIAVLYGSGEHSKAEMLVIGRDV